MTNLYGPCRDVHVTGIARSVKLGAHVRVAPRGDVMANVDAVCIDDEITALPGAIGPGHNATGITNFQLFNIQNDVSAAAGAAKATASASVRTIGRTLMSSPPVLARQPFPGDC